MKQTVVSNDTQIGNFQPGVELHPTPTAPGMNTEGAHPLAVPVPPGPSGTTTPIDHGPSMQPSMYNPPWPPK